MSEIKYLQIRDKATDIPAMAIKLNPDSIKDCKIVARAGYGREGDYIILMKLEGVEAHHSPYDWIGSRTMGTAHQALIESWDKYSSGGVVCVEYILGERNTPKSFE